MVKIRIVKKTDKQGVEYFYIDRLYYWFFWIREGVVMDMSGRKIPYTYYSIEEAKDFVKRVYSNIEYNKLTKIVKTEVVWTGQK
jgi:hypothetical protein